ncbi:Cytosolic 5'-nucleotidase 1B [Dissostichus eleginoides]|uniref:Cytosolic 5'-nucleotidase 1B n=1 Tax=Dissostichus eleginoides TaxID=100907 RepID=A0AAD9ESU2_DISEL|nr:Cytosolic 5'-nucleotidase 1B [Dissostichus eleginoides]
MCPQGVGFYAWGPLNQSGPRGDHLLASYYLEVGMLRPPAPPPEHLLCPVHPPVRETQPSSSTGAPVFKSGNFWLFALDLYFGSFPHLLVDLPVG